MLKPTFKVISAVVCDEVRREASGKETLIGVSSGLIRPNSFPCVLRLSFWIQVCGANLEDGQYDMSLSLKKKRHDVPKYGINISVNY
ncbi:DUF6941 family protein, partial [Acetobacter orientalis]|uniref:DUF6941 family protein n=2 Tax=Acetobacteraceae TaxID=433 RepID=UPI0039E7E3CC